MNEQQLFRIIRCLADNCFDGHCTVMKFTTNWRVSFGCHPETRQEIEEMASGKTLFEAFVKALEVAQWNESPKRPVSPV